MLSLLAQFAAPRTFLIVIKASAVATMERKLRQSWEELGQDVFARLKLGRAGSEGEQPKTPPSTTLV